MPTGTFSDPKKCVLIVDDMGDVGLRISDAQVVADAVVTGFRKRIGFDAVTYAGVAASAAAMKKLLATPEGAGPQEAQLKWYDECAKNAPWRVKAKFGTKKGKQWITVECRKKDAKDAVDEQRFEAKTFVDARDAMAAAMPVFCKDVVGNASAPTTGAPGNNGGVVGAGDIPNEAAPPDGGPVGMHKKEPLKPWSPPPRRD